MTSRLGRDLVSLLTWRPSRHRKHEPGQVLVLFALGIFALFGAVAVGVDGSRVLEERRNAQAAVDNAAIAATYARCTGATLAQAQAAGRASALANKYDDASAAIAVSVSDQDALNNALPANTIRAQITSTIHSTFAQAISIGSFTVTVEATAQGSGCGAIGSTGSANPGAAYAGGICTVSGKFGVDVSGSDSWVLGGVHTNDDANVGGSNNLFWEAPTPPDDKFTYVGSINSAAVSNNSFQMIPPPAYPQQVPMPTPQWPTGWAPTDLTGGSGAPPTAGSFLEPYYNLAVTNGTFSTSKITSIPADGIYYTTSPDGFDANITAPGGTANVTLIAPNGPIKIGASSITVNPFAHASFPRTGIILISNVSRPTDKTCEDPTIMMSGGNVNWNGIIWGVSGQVEISGSSNFAANGSIIAHSIKMNGSGLRIRYNSSLFPTNPTVTPSVTLWQ